MYISLEHLIVQLYEEEPLTHVTPRRSIIIFRSVHLDSCSVSPPAALSISPLLSMWICIAHVLSCTVLYGNASAEHALKRKAYEKTIATMQL